MGGHHGRPRERARWLGRRPACRAAASRCQRLPRDARPRQRPPSPLPEPHPRPSGHDGQAAVRVAAVALSPVAGDRRGVGPRLRVGRPGRARAVGLHHLDRPSLPPSARCRRPAVGRDRGGSRPGRPLPPHTGVDVAVAEGRRPAARRRGRRRRRDPRRERAGGGPTPRPISWGHGARRARAVLAVQRHRGAHGALGRAGRAARRPVAHPLRREPGRTTSSRWSGSVVGRWSTSSAPVGARTGRGWRTA